MTEREAWIALSQTPGIGPRRAQTLVETLGSPSAVFRASVADLIHIDGIGATAARALQSSDHEHRVQEILRSSPRPDDQLLTPADAAYPHLLRSIHDPPLTLWRRGHAFQDQQPAVAIVGSRRPTGYGLENARRFARALAQQDILIVSGGARGIDTAAHLGTLEAQKETVAVLGNGLDINYPRENGPLFRRIAARGALLSEFPHGRRGDKHTFPARNRIIAGLCHLTIVIEADQDSGALITAELAADYGRTVLALPGPIHSPLSRGCHALIRDGAGLCESPEQALEELGRLPEPWRNDEATRDRGPEKPAHQLTESQHTLLERIPREPTPIETIVHTCSDPISKIQVTLLQLEMMDLIVQEPGKRYWRR